MSLQHRRGEGAAHGGAVPPPTSGGSSGWRTVEGTPLKPPEATPMPTSTIRFRAPGEVLRGRAVRRLRLNPDLDPWAQGFDHAWRDCQRGVFAPTPSANWRFSADDAALYSDGYAEAHSIAQISD